MRGVGGIWGGAGGRGIRALRVGSETNVGAVRGARSSPGVVTDQRWWSPNAALGWWARGWVGAGVGTWFGTGGGRALGGGGGSSGSRSLTERGLR